jgi:DNA-binding response OmpR family regulator
LFSKKILVVDDEFEISEIIDMYLSKEGFEVSIAKSGQEAVLMAGNLHPDLIILDVLLPDFDGFEVCRQIRKTMDIPILFLSCKNEDIDIILGLGVGGDDYITKPFSPSQLVARVKANLRRQRLQSAVRMHTPSSEEEAVTVYRKGPLEVDVNSYEARLNGVLIELSSKEFDLLVKLIQQPNRVFATKQLFDAIWGHDALGDYRTVMVHICNLRKKIEVDASKPEFILTVRGVGYKFNGSVSAQALPQ